MVGGGQDLARQSLYAQDSTNQSCEQEGEEVQDVACSEVDSANTRQRLKFLVQSINSAGGAQSDQREWNACVGDNAVDSVNDI